MEARVRTASREKPLLAAQHPVDHRRPQRHQLALPGQAGAAVLEPAPVGKLVGQRAGVVELAALRSDVQRLLRITRYQGLSAHLPGTQDKVHRETTDCSLIRFSISPRTQQSSS